ncbi:flavin-containing monooxygenase [Pseudomonas sp. NFX98]|uniref:flavin-containing monooxygenase n=1 Tax=Pseudomonas sp. NFX98 TaxID=3399122 RepID=UPI0039FBBB4D
MSDSTSTRFDDSLDAIVIGAGFAGMYMLYRLRALGFKAQGFEAGSDVGGAWYWNRYPGARCDVQSLVYSYSFSPELEEEWRWSERYAAQPEIQAYLSYAADRLELRPLIQFETRVIGATFDESNDRWLVKTDKGQQVAARYLLMATGPISLPVLPNIPGIKDFRGTLLHTARWPQQQPDFRGKKVGVIGTGSSGTQIIPILAEQAAQLLVFLRTPNFTVPARNNPTGDDEFAQWVARRVDIRAAMWRGEIAGVGDVLMREELIKTRSSPAASFTPEQRREILEERWAVGGAALQGSFKDVMTDESVNEEVANFVREKIRETVKDPKKAELLIPKGFALGTKRICVGSNYYEAYNRENVEIVDIKKNAIERVTASGVVVGGEEIQLDVLIAATGFDAVTGAISSIDIRGKNGQTIHDAWQHGPYTFLGIGICGFPNLLMIGGPGSPSVLSNVVMTNEYQVDFVGRILEHMKATGKTRLDVVAEAQEQWTQHVNDVVKLSLLAKSDSWYVGANIPGKARAILAYTGGVRAYRAACEKVESEDYAGFRFTSQRTFLEKGTRNDREPGTSKEV